MVAVRQVSPVAQSAVVSHDVETTFLQTPVAMAWRVLPTKSFNEIFDPKKSPEALGSMFGITTRARPKRLPVTVLPATVVSSSDWLLMRIPASEALRTVF